MKRKILVGLLSLTVLTPLIFKIFVGTTKTELYFGNPHLHSTISDGLLSLKDFLDQSKHLGHFDFVGIVEHYENLTEAKFTFLLVCDPIF